MNFRLSAASRLAFVLALAPAWATASPPAGATDPDSEYLTVFPGRYTSREETVVKAYFAGNQALRDRGPIDVKALVAGTLPKDTPGLGPVIHVTEDWVRYQNGRVAPDSRLHNDTAYARSLGLQDIPAFPTFGAHDDTYMVPWPGAARDRLLVGDLNHSVTTYRPIFPGDTLYLVMDSRDVTDLTPATGSTWRNIAIESRGSVYNQRGEKVNEVVFRVVENLRIRKAGPVAGAGFFDIWVGPDWKSRPAHFYTDADWKFIRSVWKAENPRGAKPLRWEDVNVGDHPQWTIDGPIEASVSPVAPWGQGVGGSRTVKREILDPASFATMVRGTKDGIWRLRDRKDYVPTPPAVPDAPATAATAAIDTRDIHKEGVERAILINYMGRDYAIRHLLNWAGDTAKVENIKWTIMGPKALAGLGLSTPAHPNDERFLDRVPSMRGRAVTAHGMTTDIALVKSEVVGKQLRNGRHYVDVVWWIEAIDGAIWEEGMATVELPSGDG